ncbi:hypothetical protein H311_04001 [Anncaliia algerae PRA109]|nr:hypothetical protein H311_04001 [Anncaliia algerae PRA109]
MKISEILTFKESSKEINFNDWLIERDIMKQEMICINCRRAMFIKKNELLVDKSWRYVYFLCPKYGTNMSILTISFFKDIVINPKICLRAILYILNEQPCQIL